MGDVVATGKLGGSHGVSGLLMSIRWFLVETNSRVKDPVWISGGRDSRRVWHPVGGRDIIQDRGEAVTTGSRNWSGSGQRAGSL